LHHTMLWRPLRVKERGHAGYALVLCFVLFLLAACSRDFPPTPTQPPPTAAPDQPEPAPGITPSPTTSPYPWTDENHVMSGLCFESVYDAAGKTFVIRSPEALEGFYDLADNSQLCRQPVTRYPFDFSNGRILAGIWSRGEGCSAYHVVDNVVRDDTARTFFIFLRLVEVGDCTYELVRPFWIGMSGITDYEIQFVVE